LHVERTHYDEPLPARLIVGVGASACTFLEGVFPLREMIGQVQHIHNKAFIGLGKLRGSIFYKIDHHDLLLLAFDEINSDQVGRWTKIVCEFAQFERVIVVDTLLTRKGPYGLRSLSTYPQQAVPCPPLEAPNMVEGVSAAILTYRHRRQQETYLLLNVCDSHQPDGGKSFSPVASFLGVPAKADIFMPFVSVEGEGLNSNYSSFLFI
jgi:hypothetical protein